MSKVIRDAVMTLVLLGGWIWLMHATAAPARRPAPEVPAYAPGDVTAPQRGHWG